MRTLLKLKKGIIYGPVHSRRLGLSLGINLLPADVKVCPFNCVYCQYGWTAIHITKINRHFSVPFPNRVKEALSEALEKLSIRPAFITFSGNGEPTLHPDFGEIVDGVIEVRDRLAPQARTAILSNSALVGNKEIRKILRRLETRIMKLDCGSPEIFARYNQPCRQINLEGVTRGLTELSQSAAVTIQTLIASGKNGNLDEANIREWVKRLKQIKPVTVQLYSLDRGSPARDLQPAAPEELKWIKSSVEQTGIPCSVF